MLFSFPLISPSLWGNRAGGLLHRDALDENEALCADTLEELLALRLIVSAVIVILYQWPNEARHTDAAKAKEGAVRGSSHLHRLRQGTMFQSVTAVAVRLGLSTGSGSLGSKDVGEGVRGEGVGSGRGGSLSLTWDGSLAPLRILSAHPMCRLQSCICFCFFLLVYLI